MSGDDNIPIENDDNEVVLDSSDDEFDINNDDDDSFIPPQEDLDTTPKNEKSFDLMATLKGVISPVLKVGSLIQGVISSIGKKPKAETEGDAAADTPTDAASAINQASDTPTEDAENAEPDTKKEKRKKEKPVKVKKEKPVKEKKDPADGQDDTDSGEKKKIPALIWVIIILLLIPGNALFLLNFFSSSGNDNNTFVPIEPPDTNIENGHGSGPPADDSAHNIHNINVTFDEDDLFYLIGAAHQEVVDVLGRPEAESNRELMFYGKTDDDKYGLIIHLRNNSVETIVLISGDWTMFGLRAVNSLSRISRAMKEVGAAVLDPVKNPETDEEFHEFTFNYNDVPHYLMFILSRGRNSLVLTTGNTGSINDDSDLNGDPNNSQNGNDDDTQAPNEINLVRLMGQTSEEIIEILGVPNKEEETQSGYTAWSYGTAGNVHLMVGIYNDSVFQIRLMDSRHSIFGIECGANILDARTHLMVNLGFIYSGEIIFDDVPQIQFRNLFNAIPVMIVLASAEDGTVAEISFIDLIVAEGLDINRLVGNSDEGDSDNGDSD